MPTPQFRYYGVAEGLSSSNVYTIVQDPRGVIWMGTDNGLVRFDSAHFKVFRHDPRQPHSLAANDVSALLVDHRQRLWLGGEGTGLSLYRPATGDFRNWRHKDGDPDSLAGNDIGALAEGRDGSIWISVYSHGVDRLRPDGRFEHLRHRADDPDSLAADIVLCLRALDDGTLLIGNMRGLDRLRPDGRITHVAFVGLDKPPRVWSIDGTPGHLVLSTTQGLFQLHADGKAYPMLSDLFHGVITTMTARGPDGGLWVGTASGLVWVGPDGRHRKFPMHQEVLDGVPGALVWKLMFDHEGGLWVTTRDNGVAYLSPRWRQFTVFRHQPGVANSLGIGRVLAQMIWQGRLLVGGPLGRLDSVDLSEGVVQHLPSQVGRYPVTGLADAGQGQLWLALNNGLALYGHGRTQRLPNADMVDGANRIVSDAQGNAYASMPSGGVLRVDRKTLAMREVKTRDGTVADRDVTRLVMHRGQLWRSSMGGLARLDPQSGEFVDVPGVAPGRVLKFVFDANGFWLVRVDSLEHYRLEPDGDAMRDREVGLNKGWPGINVVAMARDDTGRLWMTSRTGLWRFDPDTGRFHVYGVEDGLPSPEFSSHTISRMPDGSMYSGTNRGIVGWNPDAMHDQPSAPQLVLARITVTRADRTLALPTDGRPLHLRWNDRELHVVAQALSYLDPSRNHYRFRLQGLDTGWVDTGTRGERDFTGLSHGAYTLHIEAAGPSGVWTELSPLHIDIDRPPWLTWWAWLAYALLAVLLFWLSWHLGRARIEQRHRMQMAERERTLAEQASAAKTSFLATLGHEIRTPMTGVLGMAELLLHSPLQPRQREYAVAIQRSGTLLLRLVNEALDMARIEAGRLELDIAAFDPRDVLGDVMQLERGVAENKGLRLVSRLGDAVPQRLRGDALRIKQILLNLVNNALKFTERGHVEIGMDWIDGGLQITVADTGPGIGEEDRRRLFQRYEQVDGPQRSSGSGLGLAICRELTYLMQGRCELLASGAQGSTFRVWLPLPTVETEAAPDAPASAHAAAYDLLLIEDDVTVAGVIRGLLEAAGHRVRHAPDGLAGLAELENHRFDALLLDLDLPGLDGFGVARMLRSRESGTHLPILAITARSGGDEEEHARDAGMDGFLRKPVSGASLQAALVELLD